MTMNYLQFLISFLSKVLGAELENSGVIGFTLLCRRYQITSLTFITKTVSQEEEFYLAKF